MKYYILLLSTLFFQSLSAQLVELSDEFDKTCNQGNWINIEDTEGWSNTHIESYGVNESNSGQLTIMPYTTAWFQSRRSNLLYKNVSGDFVFTSEVTALNRAGDDQPGGAYSLAGLMIRTPKVMVNGVPTGQENYVFLSIGSASSNSTPQFEVKNTTNNSSNLSIISIGSTTAQIRLARVGGAIVVLYKIPGGDWVIRRRYNRSDMPADVQVGFVTYADWNKVNTYSIAFHNENTLNADLDPDPSSNSNLGFNPDIIGTFEYGRFTETDIPQQYVGLDFSSSGQVPNSAILDIFGFDSESTARAGWKIWNGSNTDWNDSNNWQDGIVPVTQDSILIPNCGCPEVVFPNIDSNIECASLIVESGGQLNVLANNALIVNLAGSQSVFINEGSIINEGNLTITNSQSKLVENSGLIECKVDANCFFVE